MTMMFVTQTTKIENILGWKKAVSNINNIVSSFLLNKPLNIYMSSFRGLKKKL